MEKFPVNPFVAVKVTSYWTCVSDVEYDDNTNAAAPTPDDGVSV